MRTLLDTAKKTDSARSAGRDGRWRSSAFVAGRIAAALVVGSCVGCGPDDPSDPPEPATGTVCLAEAAPASGRPTAILGHDNGSGFLPYQQSANLNLNYGPQGGQHVYVSLKLFSPIATPWTLQFDFVANGLTESGGQGSSVFDSCAGGWTESLNLTVFMNSRESQAGVISLTATADGLAADAEVIVAILP